MNPHKLHIIREITKAERTKAAFQVALVILLQKGTPRGEGGHALYSGHAGF